MSNLNNRKPIYYNYTHLISTLLKSKFFGIALICFLIYSELIAAELPPIITYSTSDYRAGNQNWKISQDSNNFLYFANNEGLLEFNGAQWSLYPSPNETIIRSVKVIDNKVFTGCYMEFGYWERQTTGQLKYKSLSRKIKDKLLPDEHFWEITAINEWVLFQSLHRIYLYNLKTGAYKIIKPKNGVWRVFVLNNSIYYQSLNEGLYQIKNGISILISSNKILANNQICNIFQKGTNLWVQTEKEGLFIFGDGKLQKYKGKNSDIFNQNDIFSFAMLSDSSIVLGTISNGVFIISKDFNLKYHITQNNGLSNNTALSVFEDNEKNLWVGLDNGINCLNLNSFFECFVDKSGVLGTVYSSILFKGILYLGTNQGLFFKKNNSNSKFELIKGTKGQVWSLFEYGGTLFCGHNKGTFIIDKFSASNIYSKSGTWKFNYVPGRKDLIMQGHYNGLTILKNESGKWSFLNKVRNYDISSRYFEIDNDLYVYVSHEYKGILRLKLDNKLSYVSKSYHYTNPTKGKNAGLINFSGNILYFSKAGFFKLDEKTKIFNFEKKFNSKYKKSNYISGKMASDVDNKLWIFTSQGLDYFYMDNIDPLLKNERLYINPEFTKTITGYENIQKLSGSDYLIGTTDGFLIFDVSKFHYSSDKVIINNVSVISSENKSTPLEFNKSFSLDYKSNNLKISFNIPKYNKYIQTEYKYYLQGYSDKWTDWQAEPTVLFRKLPPGKYVFKVMGRSGDDSTITQTSLTFTIKKAFYASNFAFGFYSILLLFFAYMVNKSYSNFYTRQQNKLIAEHNLKMEIQQLENEQKLIKSRNIELTQNVDEKIKELAISNLDLIRKNELLKLIKDDIKKHKDTPNLSRFKSLLSDINENILGRDSWNTFKLSFDSIDKDFIKKLHTAHPSLSPSDLKLCAYLRLNLSSKEIAPILNISIRSVEIKRYRLRKKLNLNHDEGLASYIINF